MRAILNTPLLSMKEIGLLCMKLVKRTRGILAVLLFLGIRPKNGGPLHRYRSLLEGLRHNMFGTACGHSVQHSSRRDVFINIRPVNALSLPDKLEPMALLIRRL